MPRAMAVASSTLLLKPVHRMTGIPGFSSMTAQASLSPLSPGIVWSVTSTSNSSGAARKACNAAPLSVKTWTR
ncbi:MAG: hypothetical protein HONDAALG_04020 [Gammaproteobacteria bacterium]|nr:hypothetical protein [Gammaproteobacteria bacterium]